MMIRKNLMWVAVTCVLGGASVASAQAVEVRTTAAPVAAQIQLTAQAPAPAVDLAALSAEVTASVEATTTAMADGVSSLERITLALSLPAAAEHMRVAGADHVELAEALEAMAESELPAHDAALALDQGAAAEIEHGKVDSFGDFVKAQLESGLRGQELAAAIRAEHQARGRGRGLGQAGAPGQRAPDNAQAQGHGAANAPGQQGRENAQAHGAANAPGQQGRGQAGEARAAERGNGHANPNANANANANPNANANGRGRPE